MKLSLSWIFDHLDADMSLIDSKHLIAQFNRTTAEIEYAYTVHSDIATLEFVQIISQTINEVHVVCPTSGTHYQLPQRPDAIIEQWYLIKHDQNMVRWSTAADLGSTKDYLVPSIDGKYIALTGAWRSQVETRDTILVIDNKSINNRPDLWGHRGIAREIGTIFDIPLKSIEQIPVVPVHEENTQFTFQGYTVANNAGKACKRFATLIVPVCQQHPSVLWMAHRLMRIDARAINCIVDATNYLMFDLGQPLHAFDAHKLAGKTLMATCSHDRQSITLLDGQEIQLSNEDIIISDAQEPVALAGIMGGQKTAINATTSALIVEAASFDASMIRTTSMRCKKRTDASARFEKNIDPNQTTLALQRFATLLREAGVIEDQSGVIVSFGQPMEPKHIEVTHTFIQERLGITLEQSFVITTLTRLGFACKEQEGRYYITVPTFRATKDVTIPEDIVEEIARIWGYNYITPQLPVHQVQPSNLTSLQEVRMIKNILVYSCGMTELSCYPFFDTSFLNLMQWQPTNTVSVQNPVSEHWTMLASSLIPMLLRAVHENYAAHDGLRFFQSGHVWKKNADGTLQEKNHIAGVFFNKKDRINFYDIKQEISQLYMALALDISWHKALDILEPWYLPHQTAVVKFHDIIIGYVGIINPLLSATIAEGSMALFEFDSAALLHAKRSNVHYQPVSKYPAVHRDISILLPMRYTTYEIQKIIKNIHPLITSIALVDFFEKTEWATQRSLTFRCTFQSFSKTLTTQEVDNVYASIIHELQTTFHAVIR